MIQSVSQYREINIDNETSYYIENEQTIQHVVTTELTDNETSYYRGNDTIRK